MHHHNLCLLLSRFTHNHHNSVGSNTSTTHNNRNTQTTIIRPYQTHNLKQKTILKIYDCPKLKSRLNFIPITPLQKFEIWRSPILDERCKSSGRQGDDMVCWVWFFILILILLCVALNFQIPRPPFLSLSIYQVPKSSKASTMNTPICNFL